MAETYFNKTFKGYDTAQVDAFIISLSDTYSQKEKELADEINELETENQNLRNEIAALRNELAEAEKGFEQALAEKQKEYDLLCARIGERMIAADQRAEEITGNAEKEASEILSKSRLQSEDEARSIRSSAEAEAAKIIEETRKKCESVSAAADEFRARQDEMNRSISETEKRFGDALSKLRAGLSESSDQE